MNTDSLLSEDNHYASKNFKKFYSLVVLAGCFMLLCLFISNQRFIKLKNRYHWSFFIAVYILYIFCCMVAAYTGPWTDIIKLDHSSSHLIFLARDSILAIYDIAHSPVCPSVRTSHGCIIQKRLKLGLCTFRHR